MLVIPALATLIYAAFIRFTRTFDLKDKKSIERLQEKKQASDCVLREEFDQNEQNSAEIYYLTDDFSNFSAAAASAETSKLRTFQQPSINLRDDDGGDMPWDHSKDFQPTHTDGLRWRGFSIEKAYMTSSNAVIQPFDLSSEHLADDPEEPDYTQRNVGHHCDLGTDFAENCTVYSRVETGTHLPDCNILDINSNDMNHTECSPPLSSLKHNGGLTEENPSQKALAWPNSDLPACAELLDEGLQENKSSKFHVSVEDGMSSISKKELFVGSYAVKNKEQHLDTSSGFSLCSQDTDKEDVAGGVCFVKVSPELTFLSSLELVVEGHKDASDKESCELNTPDENDIAVNSEEALLGPRVVSIGEHCSGAPGFFLCGQDSNMTEIPAVVNIVAVSTEPNYPAPVESLAHALDDEDYKGAETSNVNLPEQMGQEALLDPVVVDSYEDSVATSKLLSHSVALKMTEAPGEGLSEPLDEGASDHQNDGPFFSEYGGNADNMIGDSMSVQLIAGSNILEALQGGREAFSDLIHDRSSHSARILLSSSEVFDDEAYSSNSNSYFLYADTMEDKAPVSGQGGCSESKDEMNFAFLDTPILLNDVTSAESWTDNAEHSQYIPDNASTESLHDGNQVPAKTSERANFCLEETLISSEDGIKSEIFSLYSRSSSCVSEVNMIETLSGVASPEPKNDNHFSFNEQNPIMVPNKFDSDTCTNNTRSAEFIADINIMETLNDAKEESAPSVHEISLSFANSLRAPGIVIGMGKTDNFLDLLSSSFVPEIDAFKGLQTSQQFPEQQCENDFAFCMTEAFPKKLENGENYLTGTIRDLQYSNDIHPVTYVSSDKGNNSMNHSNYSISSPSMPDENLIEIPGTVQEGSSELNHKYPFSFEETSMSGNSSYNPMPSSHASIKVSARSSGKGLPDPVLEDVGRFDKIPVDELSNKSLNENGLQDEVNYTRIEYFPEDSNLDTEASETVAEGLFEPEHQGGPELVLSQVGMPFLIDDCKETKEHRGNSNADPSHHEINLLDTLQEQPVATGTEKGLPEDSIMCECSSTDKEPKCLVKKKDSGNNGNEDDVEDLDEDH